MVVNETSDKKLHIWNMLLLIDTNWNYMQTS